MKTQYHSISNMLEYRFMDNLSEGKARDLASDQFDAAYGLGKKLQVLNKVLRRDNQLQSMEDAMNRSGAKFIRQAELRNVEIHKIRGSESRVGDFDANFYPAQKNVKDRWINIAIAKQSDVALPPVELIQIGDNFYVRDGHHRISVAHWLGEEEVDAQVYVMHS